MKTSEKKTQRIKMRHQKVKAFKDDMKPYKNKLKRKLKRDHMPSRKKFMKKAPAFKNEIMLEKCFGFFLYCDMVSVSTSTMK